jgi:hypothetical protein
MQDRQGKRIPLGSWVRISGNMTGTVGCSIDTGEFTPEFPRHAWAYLGQGVMVQTAEAGLVHVDDSDHIELIEAPDLN